MVIKQTKIRKNFQILLKTTFIQELQLFVKVVFVINLRMQRRTYKVHGAPTV